MVSGYYASKEMAQASNDFLISHGQNPPALKGETLYRVWGGESSPYGQSWSRINPKSVPNFRNAAGLPDANAARFMSVGTLKNTKGVITRKALPYDGNKGGVDEVLVPDAVKKIELKSVQGINPEL